MEGDFGQPPNALLKLAAADSRCAIKLWPRSGDAWALLAEASEEMQDIDTAVGALEELLCLRPPLPADLDEGIASLADYQALTLPPVVAQVHRNQQRLKALRLRQDLTADPSRKKWTVRISQKVQKLRAKATYQKSHYY
mmetsp:Transcript_13303/g.17560  ORF Transcript_13303/g.17560 Transcript_13303/m.17560 type:complete len:139 (+) Transcript_13303:1628-2044(+)